MKRIVKAELSKYKALCENIDNLLVKKKIIKDKYDIKSPSFDCVPGTPIPQDKKILMYIEEVTPIDNLIEILQKQRDDIANLIMTIPREDRKFIFDRYCLGYTLNKIAKEYNYSYKGIQRKIDSIISKIKI